MIPGVCVPLAGPVRLIVQVDYFPLEPWTVTLPLGAFKDYVDKDGGGGGGGGLMFNVGQLVEGFFHFPSQNLASPWQGLQ